MPELPEAETVVRGLSKYLINQRIKNIRVLNKKSLPQGKTKDIASKKVINLERRGKAIIINFSGDHSLLVHLKMTGQLIYISGSPISGRSAPDSRMTKQNRHTELISASKKGGEILKQVQDDKKRINLGHPTNDFINSMPSNHTRIIFELEKGTLYFNDLRKFGWIKILPTKDIKKDSFIAKLGPEPLSKEFTATYLTNILEHRPKSTIKSVLLDQTVVAGIGNIYADESLFGASILPYRKVGTLKPKEITKLVSEIKKVLKLGIKHSGTSIQNYKDADGAIGKMQKYLKVYGRAGLPCKNCKKPISKNKTAGRGTHFCPTCQN